MKLLTFLKEQTQANVTRRTQLRFHYVTAPNSTAIYGTYRNFIKAQLVIHNLKGNL